MCDVITEVPKRVKHPKAVDEDLYKIPPELLYKKQPKTVCFCFFKAEQAFDFFFFNKYLSFFFPLLFYRKRLEGVSGLDAWGLVVFLERWTPSL